MYALMIDSENTLLTQAVKTFNLLRMHSSIKALQQPVDSFEGHTLCIIIKKYSLFIYAVKHNINQFDLPLVNILISLNIRQCN